MRVAVLGLGKMGKAVAGRLLAGGHAVTVWNRSAGKGADLVEKGAEEADSAPAAVSGAEAVITSLTDDSALSSVMEEGGLIGELERSKLYIDMSTVSPSTYRRLSDKCPTSFLASPILGAPQAVASGAATYLVAGPKEGFEAATGLYKDLSDKVSYLGEDVALASRLKLLSNYLLLSGVAILGEVVSAAEAADIDDETMLSFLGASPLVAEGLRNRLEPLFSGQHAGWFTTALGAKDLRLVDQMAKEDRVVLPLMELVKSRYEQAATSDRAGDDLTAIVELTRPK
jgi:3-hydroxyisobutyrate dehydrogenase-like beta-hydroxyacid dehydrogenase